MNPIETVQQIYADFARGDVPAILARLADDVEWEYGHFPNPVPWLQPRRGRAAVAGFFEALAGVEFVRFEPKHFMASGPVVVDLVDAEFVVRATGRKVVEIDEVHIWHLDAAGRVAKFRHRADSWQQALACGAQPGAAG